MIGIVHLGDSGQCPRGERLAQGCPSVVINESSAGAHVRVRTVGLVGKLINLLCLLAGQYERYLERKFALRDIDQLRLDAIVCHDLLLLPAVRRAQPDIRLVFDAREYYPLQFEHSWVWRLTAGRLNDYICRNYLHDVAHVATVSDGIARSYAENYGVKPRVIQSYAAFADLEPSPPSRPLRLVHHGNCTPNRCIENMIYAMDRLGDEFLLELYLVPKEAGYFRRISELAGARANVQIKRPVPFADIVSTLNACDIGLFVPPASTFNLRHAMPNKFFEYIQARLMVVVSPLPDVLDFVTSHDLGEVTDDATPEAVARTIRAITVDRVVECKANASVLARELHSGAFVDAFRALLESA